MSRRVSRRVVEVPTPAGPARAHLHEPAGGAARSTVVLGHGAAAASRPATS